MENMELFCVKRCWGNLNFEFVHSDSVVWRQIDQDLLIIMVYAPHDFKEKQMLWDYLTREISKWNGEVVIMRDFNEVRYKSDRFDLVFNVHGVNMFNSFITHADLVVVPLGGSAFTWCHKSATRMSKLDRFLVSENLLSICPNITAFTLERYISDHRPILLRESHFDYGPTPFRFFHYWLEIEGFNKVEWNKANMICVKNVRAKHKEELANVEVLIDNGNGNEEIVNRRMGIIKSLQNINKLHSLEMAQKAKVKWSIEGDENSRYFHGLINKKRSLLNIRGIMVDGSWIDNPNRVKKEFYNHFSNRFGIPDIRRATIQMNYPNTLSLDQQIELESDVSNEEIKRAVWECGTDKAPGPDGFTFGFYRRFWNLIENDVYDAVKYFFTYGVIPKGCNSSFIALIPKIPDANMVKDYRPISLIKSLYKIIAKILANRLVSVLGDIVNEVQSAFIADRQILDGPFILNEVMHWCTVKKKQALIFKVDFEKAYDSVRWVGGIFWMIFLRSLVLVKSGVSGFKVVLDHREGRLLSMAAQRMSFNSSKVLNKGTRYLRSCSF
ncbi:RNA-directed DNA polymerase, eukaryota [Tanacetum coccineum]